MSNPLPVDASRLAIAVLGVGAIGSTFAYYLARAGHDLTVIARPGSIRFQQLQRDRALVRKTGEKAEVRIADQLDEQTAYDLVIVTTPNHQIAALLPALQRCKAKCVHLMFNTFQPERLQDVIGEARCTLGMPFVMSALDEEGKLTVTVSKSRKTIHSDRRWVALFADAGIPSAFEANMPLWLRCHVPLCIAMESIAFQAQKRGTGASWAEARSVSRGLHGGFRILEGLGYRPYPAAKKMLNDTPDLLLASMLWFLSRNKSFRELLATGVNECRALLDGLTAAASKAKSISPAAIEAVLDLRPPE